MKIKVLIADDHQLVVDGLKLMFEGIDHIEYVSSARNGQEALAQLSIHEVDVLLLDVNMPVMDGIACCTEVFQQFPDVKILALSMMKEASLVKKMLKEGAAGFLLKNAGQEEVLEAIQKVYKGEKAFSAEILDILMESLSGIKKKSPNRIFPRISRREKQILNLIVWEKTTQEIADELFISFSTVETHRKNLLHKLDVRNTAGLVRVALENGLLDE
ncbi:MAG: response regulator transcription factor [Chitinophagales bacterium]|nr:response regulator transcription factor [Chitinophagales bacterium]